MSIRTEGVNSKVRFFWWSMKSNVVLTRASKRTIFSDFWSSSTNNEVQDDWGSHKACQRYNVRSGGSRGHQGRGPSYYSVERFAGRYSVVSHAHKRMAWGCGHIPNAGNLVIIWAKFFNIWAYYTATFTFKWGNVYFSIIGKSSAETILSFFFASDGKTDTAIKWTGIIW